MNDHLISKRAYLNGTMQLRIIVSTFLLALSLGTFSQNLIPNGGFEYYYQCPNDHDQLSNAVGWFKCNIATPDYFNTCDTRPLKFGVPSNGFGFKEAYDGEGYAGLVCQLNFREYIMIRLKEPLQAGVSYHAYVYVSLSTASEFAIADFGLFFCEKPIFRKSYSPITNVKPQVKNTSGRFLLADNWYKIEGVFEAKGGEHYVMIGNFKNTTKTQSVTPSAPGTTSKAYYYIDNVSTEPVNKPRFKVPAQGEVQALEHVYFGFDKAELLSQSYADLDELANIMKRFPKLKIEIIGHTDNLGTVEYNQALSEKRAQAVVDYLIKKGINPSRLKSSGKGSSEPIVTNASEKDRQLNRRVEFKVLN